MAPAQGDFQRALSFAINSKRNTHELSRFVDIVYGAFLSYLLYIVAEQLAVVVKLSDEMQKADKEKIIQIKGLFENHIFVLACLGFLILFVVEDYKGMRVVTAICGYYLSSFRYFLDVLVVLGLATSAFLLMIGQGSEPNRIFLLAMGISHWLCSAWAWLLKKNEREIPDFYTHLVLGSHLVAGGIWFALFYTSGNGQAIQRWLGLEFPSYQFLWIIGAAFGVYYLVVWIVIVRLKKQGLPVDDMIEMFVIKILRGILWQIVELIRSLARLPVEKKLEMRISVFSPPQEKGRWVRWVKPSGKEVRMDLSTYINMHAIHSDEPRGIKVTNIPEKGDMITMEAIAREHEGEFYLEPTDE